MFRGSNEPVVVCTSLPHQENGATWTSATAATPIGGVNASALRGIIWFIIPDSTVISECSTSLTDILHRAGSIARAKRSL